MNSVVVLSLLFYTQNLSFIAHFFLQNFYPYTHSLLFVEGHLRAYYLQLNTGSTQEGPSRHNWKIVEEIKELIQTK